MLSITKRPSGFRPLAICSKTCSKFSRDEVKRAHRSHRMTGREIEVDPIPDDVKRSSLRSRFSFSMKVGIKVDSHDFIGIRTQKSRDLQLESAMAAPEAKDPEHVRSLRI